MASDGPGKFKEKKNRSSKPYDRPKGIIRRVTDTVTGLFSSTWLSGWMPAEEEEEDDNSQHRNATQVKTVAPPGESFIFAQPVGERRTFRPMYPEEGESEANSSQQTQGVNIGASTSSGVRINMPAATSVVIPSASIETPPVSLTGRRNPIISSTPTQMFNARSKSQLEPRPIHLATSTPTTADDVSEFSESSADTGVDASLIPHPDERNYQREILQLDDESLQTLRESLIKTGPITNPATSALPSLEETRKRSRESEQDQTSIRAEGSLSSKSLFSEIDISLSQPQPSALSSKRPRFNVSAFSSSPLMSDRSILSDSSFRMSPFYPGKTMFGGASSYRRGRLQHKSQTPRVQVKPKPASQHSEDGGLSRAARRILDCLEQMSTPISDAKRIPTPNPGQRGSFLDNTNNYTAVYHRNKLSPKQSGPPTSRLSTPINVPVKENISKSFLVKNNCSSLNTSDARVTTFANTPTDVAKSGDEISKEKDTTQASKVNVQEEFSSSFPKAVAELTAKFKPSQPISSILTAPSSTINFASGHNSNIPTLEFTPKPSGLLSENKKTCGKVKSKVVNSGRTSKKQLEEEEMEEDNNPYLPAVSLTMSSLPKIDFAATSMTTSISMVTATTTITTVPMKGTSKQEGFKFSSPEVIHSNKFHSDIIRGGSASNNKTTTPAFTFSNPAAVEVGTIPNNNSNVDSCRLSSKPLVFNNSSGVIPKLKQVKKDKQTTSSIVAGELKEGSVLDILSPKTKESDRQIINENSLSTSYSDGLIQSDTSCTKNIEESEQSVGTNDSISKKQPAEASQGFKGFSFLMKSSDEWECSVCMLRNKNNVQKCVACESLKPGSDNSNTTKSNSSLTNAIGDPPPVYSSIGWGDAFKKSSNEWECGTCMLRNKDTIEKCIACETPKPNSNKISDSLVQNTKISEEKTNIGFGTMFAKEKGEWECATCLVRNKSDSNKCVSCETPKPGAAAPVSQAITGNFKFGVNTSDSANSMFKFGISNDKPLEVNKSNSGFKFGVDAKTTEANSNVSGFKFGLPAAALKEDKKENASSSFTFGVTSSKDNKEESSSKIPNFNFSESGIDSTNKSDKVNAITPGFTFKADSKSSTSFAFGNTGGLKKKSEGETSEVKPATELKSGSVVDVLKTNETVGGFSFGLKTKNNDSVTNHTPLFNNVLTSQSEDKSSSESSTKTFTFGTTTQTAAPATATTTATNSFVFGKETPKTSAPSAFSFTAGINKEEPPKSSPATFSFGGAKRDATDDEHPPKKISFGSSTIPLTNNVNSNSSPFNFGKKENNGAPGLGFGHPPPSVPAFGAPASATNATPNFQFGDSAPPAPAATAPSPAFGSAPPPAFSNITEFSTNNNTSFAFGQAATKNSAGFDFGQAASSPPNTNFNFGASLGTTAAPPMFQFGQKQNDAPSSIFQFGPGNAGFEVTTPAFGGDNPFNTTTPSGRVVKKARRRKQ